MNRLALALAMIPTLLGCESEQAAIEPSDMPKVGLMSSLPIYWPESTQFGDMLNGEGNRSWVRRSIETRFAIEPLDALTTEGLEGVDRLILAQPRALSAAENVALDDWVRAGGRALIFADPMLTSHSRYSIGDPRRPQDVILLSPILARWGLELEFDEEQAEGERMETVFDAQFPVNLSGRFTLQDADAPSECLRSETGILAQCRIGEGRVTLFADAALLDEHRGEHADGFPSDFGDLLAASLDF